MVFGLRRGIIAISISPIYATSTAIRCPESRHRSSPSPARRASYCVFARINTGEGQPSASVKKTSPVNSSSAAQLPWPTAAESSTISARRSVISGAIADRHFRLLRRRSLLRHDHGAFRRSRSGRVQVHECLARPIVQGSGPGHRATCPVRFSRGQHAANAILKHRGFLALTGPQCLRWRRAGFDSLFQLHSKRRGVFMSMRPNGMLRRHFEQLVFGIGRDRDRALRRAGEFATVNIFAAHRSLLKCPRLGSIVLSGCADMREIFGLPTLSRLHPAVLVRPASPFVDIRERNSR